MDAFSFPAEAGSDLRGERGLLFAADQDQSGPSPIDEQRGELGEARGAPLLEGLRRANSDRYRFRIGPAEKKPRPGRAFPRNRQTRLDFLEGRAGRSEPGRGALERMEAHAPR